MESEQQFCLRWNDHQSTLVTIFESLLDSNTLVDCTLAAEGQCLKAHKVVLSACSPYFQLLLGQHTDKHPIVILKDVKFEELRAMIDYMYRGEVNIPQDQLGPLLKAAESLQIRGLGCSSKQDENGSSEKPVHFLKSAHDKKLQASEKRTSSPPLRSSSSGAVSNASEINQVGVSRRGCASPIPRKRSRHLQSLNVDCTNDAHSQSSNSCESLPQNQSSSISESSSVPPLAPLSVSNRLSVSTRGTEWPDANIGKSSPLASLSGEDVPPLAPLSSTNTSARDSSKSRKWLEVGGKTGSSPAEGNVSLEAGPIESQKIASMPEVLLVPKTEYVEIDDDSLTNAMLDDVQKMEASGPSHADESSSNTGFAPWLENMEGMAEEAAGQDMAAAYRTSQVYETMGTLPCEIASRSHQGKYRGILNAENSLGQRREYRRLSSLRRKKKETMTEEEKEQLRKYERDRKRIQRAKKAARTQAANSTASLWGTSINWP